MAASLNLSSLNLVLVKIGSFISQKSSYKSVSYSNSDNYSATASESALLSSSLLLIALVTLIYLSKYFYYGFVKSEYQECYALTIFDLFCTIRAKFQACFVTNILVDSMPFKMVSIVILKDCSELNITKILSTRKHII